jgi:hypothetical protein
VFVKIKFEFRTDAETWETLWVGDRIGRTRQMQLAEWAETRRCVTNWMKCLNEISNRQLCSTLVWVWHGYCVPATGNYHSESEQKEVTQLSTANWKLHVRTFWNVFLLGVTVSVLAIEPKVRGFKPGRGRWVFKRDKNPQHAFLRRASKALGQCLKTSRHVKNPFVLWQRYYVLNLGLSRQLLAPLVRCVCSNLRALMDEWEVIRTQVGTHSIPENGRSAWDAMCSKAP